MEVARAPSAAAAVAGVVSVMFGLLLVIFPGAGALAVILWIAISAVVLGLVVIALAFRLRQWSRTKAVL